MLMLYDHSSVEGLRFCEHRRRFSIIIDARRTRQPAIKGITLLCSLPDCGKNSLGYLSPNLLNNQRWFRLIARHVPIASYNGMTPTAKLRHEKPVGCIIDETVQVVN